MSLQPGPTQKSSYSDIVQRNLLPQTSTSNYLVHRIKQVEKVKIKERAQINPLIHLVVLSVWHDKEEQNITILSIM